MDEERQREQFALEEEHHLKKEAFLAKQAARKEQERYVNSHTFPPTPTFEIQHKCVGEKNWRYRKSRRLQKATSSG